MRGKLFQINSENSVVKNRATIQAKNATMIITAYDFFFFQNKIIPARLISAKNICNFPIMNDIPSVHPGTDPPYPHVLYQN